MQKVKSETTGQRHTNSHWNTKPLKFDTLSTGCMVCTSHRRNECGYTVINHRRYKRPEFLHRIIYEMRNGPIPSGYYVCHKCDNPNCCNPEHLFLGTQSDNMADMKRKGRSALGERNGASLLKPKDVHKIRQYLSEGRTHTSISHIFGVARKTISDIANGKTWKHLEPIESNRTSHLPVPDDGDSINHQPHTTGREPYCVPVQLTFDFLQ